MMRAFIACLFAFVCRLTAEPTELERYREWARYPPDSRPLNAGQVDLINPYSSERPAVPVQGSSNQCTMVPESAVSCGPSPFHVYLSCKNERGEVVQIDSVKFRTYIQDGQKTVPASQAAYAGDTGTNGDRAADGIHTFVVRPGAKDWGDMFLEADFRVQGRRHNQRAHWFSTPHNVAEFVSGLREQARGGHLVVFVPVRVLKPGYFVIEANLFQAGGRPVATASYEGDLKAGQQSVELRFFGKVIRDSGRNGPYVVRGLRGMRNNSPVTPSMVRQNIEQGVPLKPREQKEPWQEFMKPFPGELRTASYRADVFSPAEWTSPEKENRIRFLRNLEKQSP